MKRLCMIAMALVALGARADDATETRLYGARPSQLKPSAVVGGVNDVNGASSSEVTTSYVADVGEVVLFNVLSEYIEVDLYFTRGFRILNKLVAPQEIMIFKSQGWVLQNITVRTLRTNETLTHQTEPNNNGRYGGFYMVRKAHNGPRNGVIMGPFVGRSNIGLERRGDLYFVNATGYPLTFRSSYTSNLCKVDTGAIPHGDGQFMGKQIGGCSVFRVSAEVAIGSNQVIPTNQLIMASAFKLNKAVFVLRPAGDIGFGFELVGPFRLIE